MSKQANLAVPAEMKISPSTTYPPTSAIPMATPLAATLVVDSTSTSTQPSITAVEENGRAESLLASCAEVDAKGRPTSRPVAARSFFYQTLFVSIVAFPQLLAEAHIGMLIVPLLDIGRQVNTEDEHQLSWFPAAYGYVLSARSARPARTARPAVIEFC